jgi:hypothetical protein
MIDKDEKHVRINTNEVPQAQWTALEGGVRQLELYGAKNDPERVVMEIWEPKDGNITR